MSDICTQDLQREPASSQFEQPTRDLMTSGLPASVKALILAVLRTQNSCDQCLILADALHEIAAQRAIDGIDALCWLKAANALRDFAAITVLR